MSKASERQAAFVEEVRRVLSDAQAAGFDASARFAEGAKRAPGGYIADASGGAIVFVTKPTYRLREALKTLGLTDGAMSGHWMIRCAWSEVADQSITAEEVGANAALEVLRSRLPGEGKFWKRSYG